LANLGLHISYFLLHLVVITVVIRCHLSSCVLTVSRRRALLRVVICRRVSPSLRDPWLILF